MVGHRARSSSASSYSSKPPQKSTIETSQLHELLSRSIKPITVTTMENSTATSAPSQLSPGKRKLVVYPEEESNSVDKKWEEIKQLLYPEDRKAPCQPKCKRQSLGEYFLILLNYYFYNPTPQHSPPTHYSLITVTRGFIDIWCFQENIRSQHR